MAFTIQKDSNGKLILVAAGKKVYVYCCQLHPQDNRKKPKEGAIPSRASISTDSQVVDAVCPWEPVLADNMTGQPKAPFDAEPRGYIRDATDEEADQKHLRYLFWQLYTFAGDTTLVNREIKGLWTLVDENIQPAYKLPAIPPPTVGP